MQLSEQVQNNLELLKTMSIGEIAALINQRAGRVAVTAPSAQAIINQFNLIESELIEGKVAAAKGDMIQVRDAIADIILLAAGQQGIIAGINVDADYRLMCAFNMTRIPKTFEEAQQTVHKYDELDLEVEITEKIVNGESLFPVKTANFEQIDKNGEQYPPRKFLKSVNFEDAQYPTNDNLKIQFPTEPITGTGSLFTQQMCNGICHELSQIGADSEAVINALENLVGSRF